MAPLDGRVDGLGKPWAHGICFGPRAGQGGRRGSTRAKSLLWGPTFHLTQLHNSCSRRGMPATHSLQIRISLPGASRPGPHFQQHGQSCNAPSTSLSFYDTPCTVLPGPLMAGGRQRGQVGRLNMGELSGSASMISGVRHTWRNSQVHHMVTKCL